MEKRSLTKITYLEPVEVRAVINAVPHVSRHPERDVLILEVMWQAGARISETLALRPEWIGTSSLILPNLKQIKRVKQKDGTIKKFNDEKADKVVEVSDLLCRHLKDYCRREKIHKGEFVFRGQDKKRHVHRSSINRMMTKASERAGVFKPGKAHPRTGRQYKGATPHQLRHSNAMILLEQTSNLALVQQQLGHADIRTTQAYAYVKQPLLKKAVKEINWYSDGIEKKTKKRKRKRKEAVDVQDK